MSDELDGQPEQLPPYIIEAARSGRAKCKTCRRAISLGTLRLGVLVEGPYGAGHMWHHLTCAARRHLEWVRDAYRLESWNAAKTVPEKVPNLVDLEKLQQDAEERKKQRRELPYVELAPSGRSRCKHCEELIDRGAPRVVLGRLVEFGSQTRTSPINVHPRCVRGETDKPDCATETDGLFEALRANSEGLDAGALELALTEIGHLP